MGENWKPDGWEPADHHSLRETVRRSLEEIKTYWMKQGVWPATEPRYLYGAAVEEADDLIFMDRGGDPISSREELEAAYVEAYDRGTWAFDSEAQKRFIEYREGAVSVKE